MPHEKLQHAVHKGQSCSRNDVSGGSIYSNGSVGTVLREANSTAEQDGQDRGCDDSCGGACSMMAPNIAQATSIAEDAEAMTSGRFGHLNEEVHGGQLSATMHEDSTARSDGLVDGKNVAFPEFISPDINDREAATLVDAVPVLAPAVSRDEEKGKSREHIREILEASS
ncbi:hypothetical protein V6N13_148892 [Hibiscus sabdariffa]